MFFSIIRSVLILMLYICSSTATIVLVGILWILKNIRWNQRGSAKRLAQEIIGKSVGELGEFQFTMVCFEQIHKKSLKIPKGGNHNP